MFETMDQVQREIELPGTPEDVWETVIDASWLADEVDIELQPGGEARFVIDGEERAGWVEEVVEPERLTFWWGDPATRVELSLVPREGYSLLRVIESRPLEVLDVAGIPMGRQGARGGGPVLLAA